jgi:hypothetical protein
MNEWMEAAAAANSRRPLFPAFASCCIVRSEAAAAAAAAGKSSWQLRKTVIESKDAKKLFSKHTLCILLRRN